MKTLINKPVFTIAMIILLSSYIFASVTIISGFKNHEMNSPTCSVSAEEINFEKAISIDYNFEDEEYIFDIPFNTANISSESKYTKAVSEDFEFEEEPYIDDIPFNTKKAVRGLS